MTPVVDKLPAWYLVKLQNFAFAVLCDYRVLQHFAAIVLGSNDEQENSIKHSGV